MEKLQQLANNLALYSPTSLTEAKRTPVSEAEAFFASKAFQDFQKGREAELKLQLALVNRLDAIHKALVRRI
ncbi:hypothetical protein PQQ75_25435 [Paraburkholderia aspalathi]|uniref:hypothetical protein n=1 Tax=Paraburkholderia aspalathi TaxID=1324617 RepID=UPI0038BC29C9